MGHDHDHGHGAASAGAEHRGRLVLAFALIAGFFVVEAVAGVLTNSLALLTDAGHMLTDVIGLGMALAAIQLAERHRTRRTGSTSHTFGLYRLEILAAFVNALLLFGVAVYVMIEAIRRLGGDPEVDSGPMLVVAIGGLVVNAVAFFLLRAGSKESLNVEGAYLEVLADLVGSVGAVAAGVVILAGGPTWVDALVALGLGAWILPRTLRLGRKAVRILLESAPLGLDVDQLRTDLGRLPGVIDVHDLHVWTLTSGMESASAHLMTTDDTDHHHVLDQARELLKVGYGIDHATLQVEPESHTGCHDLHW